jgi:peptidoglycan L-alanyl-D-glutamate endopeptidase CwlK
MALRTLDALLPHVKAKAEEFLRLCDLANIDVLIYCTYRTYEEQEAEYAKGRTVAGKIVTNAKGGDSYHNWGRAFDCVPMVNGRAQWSDNALYDKIGSIGKSIGLEWGGDWKFKDRPHFQYTEGKTIAMIRKDGNA